MEEEEELVISPEFIGVHQGEVAFGKAARAHVKNVRKLRLCYIISWFYFYHYSFSRYRESVSHPTNCEFQKCGPGSRKYQ